MTDQAREHFELAVTATWVPAKVTDTGWRDVQSGMYSLSCLAVSLGQQELYEDLVFLIDLAKVREGVPMEAIEDQKEFVQENISLVERELFGGTVH